MIKQKKFHRQLQAQSSDFSDLHLKVIENNHSNSAKSFAKIHSRQLSFKNNLNPEEQQNMLIKKSLSFSTCKIVSETQTQLPSQRKSKRNLMSAFFNSDKVSYKDEIIRRPATPSIPIGLQKSIKKIKFNDDMFDYNKDLCRVGEQFKQGLELQQILMQQQEHGERDFSTSEFLLIRTLQQIYQEDLLRYVEEQRQKGRTSKHLKDKVLNKILEKLNQVVGQVMSQLSRGSSSVTLICGNLWRVFVYVIDLLQQRVEEERENVTMTHLSQVSEELSKKRQQVLDFTQEIRELKEIHEKVFKNDQQTINILKSKLKDIETQFQSYRWGQEEISTLEHATATMKDVGMQIKAIGFTCKNLEAEINERDLLINQSMYNIVQVYQQQKLIANDQQQQENHEKKLFSSSKVVSSIKVIKKDG